MRGVLRYDNVPSNSLPQDFLVTVTASTGGEGTVPADYAFTWTLIDTGRLTVIQDSSSRESEFVAERLLPGLTVMISWNRKSTEWYAVYSGKVGGIRATDPPVNFCFYVRGTAKVKDEAGWRFWRWNRWPLGPNCDVTVEQQVHWIQPR